MVEFNHAIWSNWVLDGYKFVLFRDMDSHIILKPVPGIVPEEMLRHIDASLFAITADEIWMMAGNEAAVKIYCEDIDPE